MKRISILAGTVLVGLTVAFSGAVAAADGQTDQTAGQAVKAQEETPSAPAATQSATPSQREGQAADNRPAAATLALVYKPPLGLGAPTGLVAGGSRGANTCLAGDSRNGNTTLTLSVL